jgi:hypothetical protein
VTPNAFAWLALGGWPIVVLAVYAARRSSARIARTTAWMMILPTMFLPTAMRFSWPPGLHKHQVAFLSIWIALEVFHGRELRAREPSRAFPRLALLVLAAGEFLTVRGNGDVLTFGPRVIPGLALGDWVTMVTRSVLSVYLPFAVGQRVFRTDRDLRDLLEVLSFCGLIYLPFCLVELRLSPQLHHWFYGFTPGTFLEALRGSGYRPIVFMDGGLAVATFAFTTLVAALAVHKARLQVGFPSPVVRTVLTGGLVLACKSLGAITYSVVAVPLRLLFSSAMVMRVAAALAILVIAFPVLRIADAFPTSGIVEVFARIEPQRAASLAYRFRHEDALIERALERPLYGWGYYARGWIYEEDGSTSTVTDGLWIVLFNSYGLVGFLGFFALIVVPILQCLRHRERMSPGQQVLASSLALIVAVYGIDSLPNTMNDFLPLAYAGALHTLAARLRRVAPQRAPRASSEGVTRVGEWVAP